MEGSSGLAGTGRSAHRTGSTVGALAGATNGAPQHTVIANPSAGTMAVSGVDPADKNQMDGLLLPPALQDGEVHQEFCELAVDVASSPGGHRFSDDDECGSAESLAQAFGRTRTGHFQNWRKVTNNALGRIASKRELLQFVKDVEKAVVRHQVAQDHRMRSKGEVAKQLSATGG